MTTPAKHATPGMDLPDEGHLTELAQFAMDQARARGASDAAVGLSSSVGLTANVRNGEVESVEFQRDNDLGITVYFGQQRGHATTADLRRESITDIVNAACDIARHTQPDEFAGLAERELLATQALDLELDHPQSVSVAQATERALAAESRAFATDPRIDNSEGAAVTAHRGRDLLATTRGFWGIRTGTDYTVSTAVIARDSDDMQRDYWYQRALDASAMDAAEQVGETAALRAVRRLNARPLKTCQAPVLYPPELARGLISHLMAAISGAALYRRASFLLDAAGDTILPANAVIEQTPHLPGAFGAAWHDSEGVATQQRRLIDNGTLTGYLLGCYAARKLGLASTGNAGGPQTLLVRPTGGDAASLMKQAGRGLLVTELLGQGVSTATGDYSRGAAGIWFEDGEPAYAVDEITIAGNLKDMYRNIAAFGEDVMTMSSIRCGSILVDGMTVAGQS